MDDVEYPTNSEYDRVTNHSLTSIFLLQRIGAPLPVCIKDLQVPNRAASRHDDGEFPDHSDPGTVDRGSDSC